MHPALATLLKLRGIGLLRRVGSGLKKPAGIVFAIFATILIVIWFMPVVLMMFTADRIVDPEPIRRYGPAVLLFLTLGNMLNRNAMHSLRFSPAEIDLLYPAPFTRRELLTYKVAINLLSSIGLGLFFSLLLLQFTSRWVYGFIALTLAMLLVNLLSMAVVLSGQSLGLTLRRVTSKAAAIAIALGLLTLVALTIPIDRNRGIVENLHAVLDSPVISAVLLPFSVFTDMLTAESWLVFGGMAGIAILMCLSIFAANVLLDRRNIETSIVQGKRYHDHVQRAKKRAGIALVYSERSVRWRMSDLPWFGGAGPILQRQLTSALRSVRSLFIPMMAQVLAAGIIMVLIGRDSPTGAVVMATIACVMLTFALPQMLLFDFRGDLDQMDWLKMLPIPPAAMVVGELVTPVIIITLIQWLLLGSLMVIAPDAPLMGQLIIAALVLPVNFLNITIDNGMFLAYPTRRVAAGMGDLTALGRNMFLFIGKSVILLFCVGVIGLIATVAWWLAGGSWIAFTAVAWILLAAAGVGAVPIVARLFRNFDVSRDMPT